MTTKKKNSAKSLGLYFCDKSPEEIFKVSEKIVLILEYLADIFPEDLDSEDALQVFYNILHNDFPAGQAIKGMEEYAELLPFALKCEKAAKKMKKYEDYGIGDTSTDEIIADYFENLLIERGKW